VIIPFVLIITFNAATVVSLCKNKMQSNSSNRRAHAHVFTKLTVLTGITFTIANSADVVFAVTRIFSLPVDVKFVLNHREEFLYLNNVMNPIICFVVCKSARDDVKTFLLMIAIRLQSIRVRRRPQQGTSIATVGTGTGHGAIERHEQVVKMKTASAAGVKVRVESDRANTGSEAGVKVRVESDRANTGSAAGVKVRVESDRANTGSAAGVKVWVESDRANTGSAAGVKVRVESDRANKASAAGVEMNEESDNAIKTNDTRVKPTKGYDAEYKLNQGPDKSASAREGSDKGANVSEESDKSASTREGSDKGAI